MMTNYQYEFQYQDLRVRNRLRFNPTPRLTPRDYTILLCALCQRLMCPRLPYVGERILVRSLEEAAALQTIESSTWTEHQIEAVGDVRGVPTEAYADGCDETIVRGTYRNVWRFAPGSGPAEVLQ